jgi:hypothetical protein
MSKLSSYEVYKEAKARIETKQADNRDEVIVALWGRLALIQGELKGTKGALEAAETRLRTLTARNEILEGRAASGKPKSLCDIVQQAINGDSCEEPQD